MDSELDRIKQEILAEYDRRGHVNVASVVAQFPAYRDSILEFWLWTKGTPRGEDDSGGPLGSGDSVIVEHAIREACLAVSLGPAWLSGSATEDDDEAVLGKELEALRAQPYRVTGTAPTPFRRAAVTAWAVAALESDRERVSRLCVQKTTYILELGMNLGLFCDHKKNKLGPYDPTARYKDAEPIARKQGWLVVAASTLATTDSNAWKRFAGRYVRSEPIAKRLVAYLGRFTDAELETLATVLSVVHDLPPADGSYDVTTVRTAIASIPAWKDKLRRAPFSVHNVKAALERLEKLRLVPG